MRSLLLFGAAVGSLLLLAGQAQSAEPAAPTLDYGVPASPDAHVYTGQPDRVPSVIEYRHGTTYPAPPVDATFDGQYDAEGRWTGTWDGTYEAADGRRFEGRYEGTVEGAPGHAYYQGYRGDYDPRQDEEMFRRCGQGGAVGGAVVGGLVGGIAGNRIAGRGDRAAGTLIGGGVGALAGAAIGSAADRKKCEEWWGSRAAYYRHGHMSSYYHGGYGWYSPSVVVVTTITHGAPVVTETVETSTRTYYENVPARKRYVAKKKWKPKPKPKPRCVC
ncbi:MAG: glycine zipper 2TM domain-containing protein [Sphingopyxis sp.]|uniref:glycine zipper domain-containing protein n=1 Tax=Sphingopyxis sp. TaxID=1908224 RepID=UPI002ABCFA2A|nr:glycine zipper 2TM domain-containing protein [Sphingopyxis sp.]MDZ3831589.1 glycine zipper 2TM domain-containing protein [Sphingopyxis sp.]